MWTKWHFYTIIPTFIVLIGLAILVAYLLRNKSEKVRVLPFQIMAVALLAFEIAKQIYNIDDDGYNLYALPFHYCSLFLYIYPLHAFYKGKHKQTVDTLAFSCGAALFFFMLVMPAVVYSDGNIQNYFKTFDSFHTVTFHSYVCFCFFLMVAMRMYKMDIVRDLKVIAVTFGGFVLLGTAMSYAFNTNFQNLLHCNLAPAEEVRVALVESIGWFGQALYILVLFVLTIVFTQIAYFAVGGLLRLIELLFGKKKGAKKA